MHIEDACTVLIDRGDNRLHEIEFDVRSVFALPLPQLAMEMTVVTRRNVGQADVETREWWEDM